MAILLSILSASLLVSSLHEPPKKVSHNVICLFSTSASNAILVREEAMLDSDIPGLAKRDLLVSVITRNSDPELYDKTMRSDAGFALVLFDAEGKTRYKSNQLVPSQVLYDLVDGKAPAHLPSDRLERPDFRR